MLQLLLLPAPRAGCAGRDDLPSTCYLFSYFHDNGQDGLHLAWSRDGLKWEALRGGKSFLTPQVGKSKLMRDPCVVEGPDGTFHMVWTDSWDSRTIGYASTKDFVTWSSQNAIPVMEHEPTARNCWAPEIVYDQNRQLFMIFWATTIPEKFTGTWFDGTNDNNHRIYLTTTRDFETFTPAELFFDPGFNVIDSTLLARDGRIFMIFKDERKLPEAMKNLRLAVADTWAGPYRLDPAPINPPGAWVEGPSALTVGEYTYLYFDVYRQHRYGALRTRDMKTWEDVTDQLYLPKGIRHGTAFPVSRQVVQRLLDRDQAASGAAPKAAAARVAVDVAAPGIPVSPVMHGVFFEDINYGADGGLYAELLPNRSFENRDAMFGWAVVNAGGAGDVIITNVQPLNASNPNFARLAVQQAGKGFGLANVGYEQIAVGRGRKYLFSARVRAAAGYAGGLLVRLEDQSGKKLAESRIRKLPREWGTIEARLQPRSTAAAKLVVLATDSGVVDLDVVSLFPEDTWNKRRNGLRADLVQMLADMKPGFVRFPGGCIVEGKDLANAYRWKETIGDIAERRQNWNRWQDAVSRKAPQYYQTYGLGFFEYFQLCEDIGAEPVPILNCGMSCQFQDAQFVPLGELDPWVQDALDLVEFANGPATSPWGRKRAEMGHPEPFHLKLLGIGNEQWDEPYFARYLVFYKALKAKYPEITLITTSGPGVDDRWWNLAWSKFKQGTPAELVDEHYYRPPQWFLEQVDRYDAYDRNGPKVFAGEFAAHERDRRSTLRCAVNEAAFMTGLLRNADVVRMASYAPLFARAGLTQWEPDLIWFDATRVYGTPSYYVQQLFSRNRPDVVLPTTVSQPSSDSLFRGRIGVGTWNTRAEFKDLKVTSGDRTLFKSDFSKGLSGWKQTGGKWEVVEDSLRQTSQEENCLALIGDPGWTDYTLSLKARKLEGAEGFIVVFQTEDDARPTWWNLGGWRNTQHGLELAGQDGGRVNGSIETGRWYDVRIELNGSHVSCYLDGRLIQQQHRTPPRSIHAVAGRDAASGELILDVVNTGGKTVDVDFDLGTFSARAGTATVLTSASLEDVNSFEQPTKVAPRQETLAVEGTAFRRSLAPNSVTILRVKGK